MTRGGRLAFAMAMQMLSYDPRFSSDWTKCFFSIPVKVAPGSDGQGLSHHCRNDQPAPSKTRSSIEAA